MKPYRTTNGLVPIANVEARKTFRVRVVRHRDGDWVATCGSPACLSRAGSEAEALEKLRAEIRYRVEYCPCTGVGDDYVQLEVERG
ncbi:MAG TPA: hypothetical protein VKE22_18925 [Haliangiales bacterium]|nr:hypothetical protein [Haliangiales bacterium]